MLRRVTRVSFDLSEECMPSIISVLRFLVTDNVPSSPILVTLMMEAICFSETSGLTRATQRNMPEHCILHSLDYSANGRTFLFILSFL
jgi:hypothetical protein